jgi:hypothetical protein
MSLRAKQLAAMTTREHPCWGKATAAGAPSRCHYTEGNIRTLQGESKNRFVPTHILSDPHEDVGDLRTRFSRQAPPMAPPLGASLLP